MSAEQAIQEQWLIYEPLSALIPSRKIWTGIPPQDSEGHLTIARPFVAILAQGDTDLVRTSGRNLLYSQQMQIAVFADTLSTCREIEGLAKEWLHATSFEWSRGKVLDMKWQGSTTIEDPDDHVWMTMMAWNVRLLDHVGALWPTH